MALLVSACLPEGGDERFSSPTSLAELNARLSRQHGNPISPEKIESFLSSIVPHTFHLKEQSSSTLYMGGKPVSRARIVATNEEGYLAVVVHDYVADSISYLRLYQRYLQDSPPEPPASLAWAGDYGGFAWIWQEAGTDIHYLEAGLFDRYHVQVRSNLTDAASVFHSISHHDWWAFRSHQTE